MALRPYQQDLVARVESAWANGAQNVLMRADTGAGKTVMLSDIVQRHRGASAIIAHRQELVGQLSMALARNGVRHNIIAAQKTRRAIADNHLAELGASFYHPNAPAAVASVDTLIRAEGLDRWFPQVTLWITDEGHHLVNDNKWHTAIGNFTNPAVRGLLPTATPSRADGKGLGRHADGVADVMVEGPPMRWLIDQGYLTDYRVICVESDMQLLEADIGAGGDWSTAKLRAAARASRIVGDVVTNYLRFAPGKLGVTFCPDTDTAAEICAAYNAAGVRAGLLTGKTEDGYRRQLLRQFADREYHQLVVVDIVSEGFDLPAIEVGTFARATASLATYMQQFGRTLRIMPGKERAIIIDHVGNTLRHGLPDRPRPWTLDSRERRSRGGPTIPLRICLGCFQPYERTEKACPYCAMPIPEPEARNAPGMVDGDLCELDAETLARLRGAVEAVDASTDDYRARLVASGCPAVGIMSNVKVHAARQDAQRELRDAMGRWAYPLHAAGLTDSNIQREFWFRFGVSVIEAMALGRVEAAALMQRVDAAVNAR